MSGGIGPVAKDISLPPGGEDEGVVLPGHTTRLRFLSFRQLNSLAVSLVLGASGMVAISDLAFAILSLPYVLFLSRVAFPSFRRSATEPPVFGFRNRLLAAYVAVAALLGLLLPIAYILEGVLEGDKEGVKAAAPHVFLLASQVFMEGVTHSPRFSLPVRAFVPVLYNSRRMFTIADWLRDELGKEAAAAGGSTVRLLAGRGLATANLIFWAFNLFAFLLPVYLPRALSRHYRYKEKN
ncbi:hypothetical protein AXF42_Ash018957 [Apostasia shenzhenica]|uniref:DUF7733 domain-containing protein n=1 Tax=Apostasia shenzhenica TaxID=1088818 RepID=A0A2I0B4P1_9ASPA|nr:hypothetical protein AXF42_Ash018957 [Apostasia shenzhenica]